MTPPAGDSAARNHALDYPLPNEEHAMRDRSARDRSSDHWSHPEHWSRHPFVRHVATCVTGLAVAGVAAVVSGGFTRISGIERELRQVREALIRLEARFDASVSGGRTTYSSPRGHLQFHAAAPTTADREEAR